MKKRIANDAYNTPLAVAGACVRRVEDLFANNAAVHEPHVGGGAFLQALHTQRPDLLLSASDIDRDVSGFAYALANDLPAVDIDFLDTAPENVDWFVGNPPYDNAQAHVEHAIKHAQEGVVFLLRLAFLESKKRSALFNRGGLTAYALFVWRRGFEGHPIIRWMDT